MSRRPLQLSLVLTAFVATSCVSAVATPPISTSPERVESTFVVTTAPATTSTSVAVSDPGTTPNPAPRSAGVLLTNSGVTLALLDETPSGFLVRTPCGIETILTRGHPIDSVDVVLDPGHGGAPDPGAVGPNGLKESTINLTVARAAQALLMDRGLNTVLTRTSDYTSPLSVRALFADNSGAELMVSIHHNAPTANLVTEPGTEIFVQHESTESRRLGGVLYEEIVSALSQFDLTWSSSPDAGVLEVLSTRGVDAYGMLRTPETVTALVELGYISNRPEAELFLTDEYVSVAARAIANAVESYLTTADDGAGYVDTPRVFNPQPGVSSSVCEDPELS